jgi:hypothetical protein
LPFKMQPAALQYGIQFSKLYTLTNMPIKRFAVGLCTLNQVDP